ncbi:putative dehydrogenase [Ascodesmis nigricans]|uniref:Putative dehydrogenase n=1 Tax=Ascodesmis nigricans TaxID=341454 RepID=A0A4S2MZY6_9PEZI|nr:putative dehydrogenase [Ascodesmis nigricans]
MTSPVILLTGASRGIGLSVAHFLLSTTPTARLILAARSTTSLSALHEQYPDRTSFITADFSLSGEGKKVVQYALDTYGRLDALCVVHGVLDPVKRLEDAVGEEWGRAVQIGLVAVVEMVQAAIPELRKTKGRAVFVSSGAAVTPYLAWGAYGAMKAALNHLAMTLAAEEPEIRSISVRPGVIDTQMQDEIREKHGEAMREVHERFLELKAQGKLLRPEQPGNVIARLALSMDKELSGKFLSWNSPELAAYQDK